MATAALLTRRDIDILQALDLTPLTARQMLALSGSFAAPFTTERKVRGRLHALCAAGRVRHWPLVIAGRGAPNCYSLTPLGYRILHGADSLPPTRRAFAPVGIARQQHMHALAEFLVHTLVALHRRGFSLHSFSRENTLRLEAEGQSLFPDCAFHLRTGGEKDLRFFVELDNGTERIRSPKDIDSWQRKIRLYEAVADTSPERFRVLIVSTRSAERQRHLLAAAAALVRNPRRSLFYGIVLDTYLSRHDPLTEPCFLDHRGNAVPLVPLYAQPGVPPPPPSATLKILLGSPAS